MDQFRSRFLGQVTLAPKRSLGTEVMDVASELRAAGCTLIGFHKTEPSLTPDQDLQAKVDQVKASGFRIIEVRSSRPRSAFVPPGTIVTADMVPVTELWACPASYQSPIYPMQCKPGSTDCGPGTPEQAPREGCTKIGVQDSWLLNEDLKGQIEKAKASGFEVVFVKTGRIIAQGSKSESDEQFIWACPRPGQTVPQPQPQPLPLAPTEKPDLVPVAAGAGVVAILAALIGGAFGK